MSATPLTLKTLGPRSRVLLLKAREGALKLHRESERQTAMRLHQRGLLDRGRTRADYHINLKGEELPDGR